MSLLRFCINLVTKPGFRFSKKKSIFPGYSGIEIHDSFAMGEFRNLQVQELAKIKIGELVRFREFCNILVNDHACLTIHKNGFFNNYCSINCLESIEIGENTMFGEGVKIYDHNHKYSNNPVYIEKGEFTTSPVTIGKNCWIGSNVTVLKGVSIGDSVIIGANCLIYKSIPSDSIVTHTDSLQISSRLNS